MQSGRSVFLLLTVIAMAVCPKLHGQIEPVAFGYTYVRPDGNRYVQGRGAFPHVRSLDIELSGRPVWVVAAPGSGGSVWATVLEDGRIEAFSIVKSRVAKVRVEPERIPPGAPPILVVDAGIPKRSGASPQPVAKLLPELSYQNNYRTHPVVLPRSGKTAAIDDRGNLVISQKSGYTTISVDALPDARIVFDEKERLAILTGPTDIYGHSILGDDLEATRITIVETDGQVRVAGQISVDGGKVIEGLSPILADITGDGQPEIVVTVSDAEGGAQIAAYSEDGKLVGAGPEVGRGYRWIHQIAAAPFGPGDVIELAAVRTPHVGGMVEYYRLFGGHLSVVAHRKGFSTHRIGSRNLDMAVAGDFDGDGAVELLLPNYSFDMLLLLSRTTDGVAVESTYPVDGTAQSNVAAVWFQDEALIVGVGRADGVLRVWVPYLYL
jgi:hypothetical protein